MKMHTIWLLCSVILISNQFNQTLAFNPRDFDASSGYCQTANNVTDDEILAWAVALRSMESKEIHADGTAADTSEDLTVAFSTELKCFALCMFDYLKVLDEADKIDIELIKAQEGITGDSVEAINDCKSSYDDVEDACEYGFKMFSCFFIEGMHRNN